MAPRTKTGSENTGVAIRERRIALGLTIENAAAKAGIGSKTWGRYESGAAMRYDKIRGVCRALGWSQLPDEFDSTDDESESWTDHIGKDHPAWSDALEREYGRSCAQAFAIGSDLLSDHVEQDLEALAKEPRWTHVGELGASWLDDMLPPQFATRYDYEFMYSLKWAVESLRKRFARGELVARSVIEELAVYLILGHAEEIVAAGDELLGEDEDWREWAADIMGDLDVELFLYSSAFLLTPEIAYHYDHWLEPQFWSEEHVTTSSE